LKGQFNEYDEEASQHTLIWFERFTKTLQFIENVYVVIKSSLFLNSYSMRISLLHKCIEN